MKTFTSSLSLVAICAIAAPAAADITAAELWAEWQSDFSSMGGTLNAVATETANGVTIDGVEISTTSPGMTMTQSYGRVEMTDNSDGTVSVEFVDDWQMAVDFDVEGETGSIVFVMSLTDDSHVVSGDVDAYSYASTMGSLSMAIAEVSSSSGNVPKMDFDLVMSDVTADIAFSGPRGERVLSGSQSVGGMEFVVDVAAPPGESGALTARFDLGPSRANFDMDYDELIAFAAAASAIDVTSTEVPQLPPLYDFDVQASYDNLSFEMAFADGSTQFQAAGANAGGRYNVALGEQIVYDLGGQDMTLAISSNEIPFPISVAVEETGLGLTMPLSAGPDPQDFGMTLTYRGLTINEEIWSMFDPGQGIPRDPITVLLDLAGSAVIFTDLIGMDPTQLSGPPGELRSATLNTLDISAAGAQLTGSGAVEFAPGQLIPMPVGQINLGLSGLNGLLDTLTNAGLLPVEQAGMARAMTGMFARPGAGPDTLESTIEFLPGGGITANGIPLQ